LVIPPDSGKITKASVSARLKLATDREEKASLLHVKQLLEAEAAAKTAVKAAQDALELKVFKKYPQLSAVENKLLIAEDKWLATLQSNIIAEIERVTQQLANRVKTLEERYAEPLPALTFNVDTLSAKVDEHLRKMGLKW